MKQLFNSIENVIDKTKDLATYEIILVNDSPDIQVEIPSKDMNIRVICNRRNMGIQNSRINGVNNAKGEWILFLDQDDELIADGFRSQIYCTQNADVVVGNGIYNLGEVRKKIYKNKSCMRYLIKEKNFIQIRNLIYSPGQCLIKKNSIPTEWMSNALRINGADDWLLWILMFKKNCKYVCNSDMVYIHNDTNGQNLSADLGKMRSSAIEARNFLERDLVISKNEGRKLQQAIDFKYYQDTKQLSLRKIIQYIRPIWNNCVYKFTIICKGRLKNE